MGHMYACVHARHTLAQIEEARRDELGALAVRKYLDALCVFFWAATSLMFT
jgi:ATP-binding cassette subfamily C (CFTR/MRP) protein 10